jgi:hypothetical protein
LTLFITSNLEKPNSTDSFTTKLNPKFPWPPIMPKQRERILSTTRKKSTGVRSGSLSVTVSSQNIFNELKFRMVNEKNV